MPLTLTLIIYPCKRGQKARIEFGDNLFTYVSDKFKDALFGHVGGFFFPRGLMRVPDARLQN